MKEIQAQLSPVALGSIMYLIHKSLNLYFDQIEVSESALN